jgi:hypothetical protein
MAEDEIDKILADDPNANVVEGGDEVWLLTGDQVKAARKATGRDQPPPEDRSTQ